MDAPVLFSTWDGAGDHTGHVVTLIESWPTRIDNARVEFCHHGAFSHISSVSLGTVTCGRVRCSCTEEWDIGGFPIGDDITPPVRTDA